MLPSAHPSPKLKRHLDRFSRFCTAHGRVSSGMPGHVLFPKKIVPSHGVIWTPFNTCFLGSTRVHNPNSISIRSAGFAQLSAHNPYTLQCLENVSFPWESDPQLIRVPWAHPSPQPKRNLDRFSRFFRGSLLWLTDRQTTLLCNNRPHLRGCGLIIISGQSRPNLT